jgi:membrane-bound ClpP family serine protease
MSMFAGMRSIVLAVGILSMPAPSVRAQEPAVNAKAAVVQAQEPNPASLRPAPTQLLDRVAKFFREPIVYVALIAIGIIGLIFEFKLPGTTFPGSVAALAFVLFFWAHSFVGEFTLLAIMLFLLGLVFLGIEVFVVPGLGFSGVAGVILMFLGLLLVTLEHWPENQEQWTELGSTFGKLTIGISLAIVGSIALTWSLPSIPILNKMVLRPPAEESENVASMSLSNSGTMDLLGAIGVAVTPLRPAGKAQFGERFLDVMAEGDYVAPGGRVQVVEIEGTRIIVKEV